MQDVKYGAKGYNALEFGNAIAVGAPSLAPAIAALDKVQMHELDSLHGELSLHTGYLGALAREDLRLALEVAFLAHCGQRRRSGESFITHPVAVASILAVRGSDAACVVAGLLHDTVEDTVITFADVERLFGQDVRRIVEGETKVSKLPKMVRSELDAKPDKNDEQAENLRSMFVAMAEDWRIVVVKLADRLHNMRTLQCVHRPSHPPSFLAHPHRTPALFPFPEYTPSRRAAPSRRVIKVTHGVCVCVCVCVCVTYTQVHARTQAHRHRA